MSSSPSLNDEAARLGLLLDVGAISSAEVIAWADFQIIESPKPCSDLIDISLTKERSVRDALLRIAVGANTWSSVAMAMPALLEFVGRNPNKAALVASAFYHIAVEQRYEVPAEFSFFNSAEDDFALANDGVFDKDEVYSRFVENMRRSIAPSD